MIYNKHGGITRNDLTTNGFESLNDNKLDALLESNGYIRINYPHTYIDNLGTINYLEDFIHFLKKKCNINKEFDSIDEVINYIEDILSNEDTGLSSIAGTKFSNESIFKTFYFMTYYDIFLDYLDFLRDTTRTEFRPKISIATYIVSKLIFSLRECLVQLADFESEISKITPEYLADTPTIDESRAVDAGNVYTYYGASYLGPFFRAIYKKFLEVESGDN